MTCLIFRGFDFMQLFRDNVFVQLNRKKVPFHQHRMEFFVQFLFASDQVRSFVPPPF